MVSVSQAVEPFIRAAQELAPKARQLRDEIERERSLPPMLVDHMRDAGLFALWVPKALGGLELTLADFVRVIEEVSRIDGSVGWCCMLASSHGRFAGYLEEQVARNIFSGGRNIVAGTLNPTGKAIAAPGGFSLSGHWTFASFIRHADWVYAGALVHDANGLKIDASGHPEFRLLLFPADTVEIIDTWKVSGLRGTGSNDFEVTDVFVPDEYTILMPAPKPFQPGALYAAPLVSAFHATFAPVAIGIARTAIDTFVELAGRKKPFGSQAVLRDKPSAQIDLGKAEALLGAARAYLFDAVEELWNEVVAGNTPSLRQRAIMHLASAQGASMAAQAVDALYDAAGGSALFESNLIERCFRDVHATTQHVATYASNFELGGRVLFGLDPGPLPL